MADERTEERGHEPIALPAGSFYLADLEKNLDQAISVKNVETHPERINKAIVDSLVDKRTLANLDTPAIPNGAKLVEQDTVYIDGAEPVKTKGIVFEPVDAEDGTAAAGMRYADRTEKGAVVATDEVVAPDAGDAELTLSGQAAEELEQSTDTDTGKAGAKPSK